MSASSHIFSISFSLLRLFLFFILFSYLYNKKSSNQGQCSRLFGHISFFIYLLTRGFCPKSQVTRFVRNYHFLARAFCKLFFFLPNFCILFLCLFSRRFISLTVVCSIDIVSFLSSKTQMTSIARM